MPLGHDLPQNILGFLDLRHWNPVLMFVMVGAILVYSIAFRLIMRRAKPVLADTFEVPTRSEITPEHRAGAISFVIDGIDVTTVGALLDQEGIAVRAGHHCAQPTLAHFGLKASVRPSFALYNNATDVDALIAALDRIIHKPP